MLLIFWLFSGVSMLEAALWSYWWCWGVWRVFSSQLLERENGGRGSLGISVVHGAPGSLVCVVLPGTLRSRTKKGWPMSQQSGAGWDLARCLSAWLPLSLQEMLKCAGASGLPAGSGCPWLTGSIQLVQAGPGAWFLHLEPLCAQSKARAGVEAVTAPENLHLPHLRPEQRLGLK